MASFRFFRTSAAALSAAFLLEAVTNGQQAEKQGEKPAKASEGAYKILKTFDVGEVQVHKDPGAGGIGSSDIGNLSQIVPTINPYLKISEAPTHSPEFATAAGSELGAERMIVAAKAMAMTAIDLLMAPVKVNDVWADFKKNQAK